MPHRVRVLALALVLTTAATSDASPDDSSASATPNDSDATSADDAPPTDSEDERDSDGDGLPDQLERETGTEPLRADTDRDGIPDGVEDANQDGIVDPGESDPRRPGLYPGTAPHIPEPLNFDLVRGLGARKGELETNVLFSVRPGGQTTWAPEVEWAFADNLAIEAELPMVDRELHALKAAFQWTAPSPSARFAHGLQFIGEYMLDDRLTEVTGLYLSGVRVGPFSFFAMSGLRAALERSGHHEILVNPSVFVDLDEALTIGVETNVAIGLRGGQSGLALGQLHYQVARRFRVQIGAGAELDEGRLGAVVGTRLILE